MLLLATLTCFSLLSWMMRLSFQCYRSCYIKMDRLKTNGDERNRVEMRWNWCCFHLTVSHHGNDIISICGNHVETTEVMYCPHGNHVVSTWKLHGVHLKIKWCPDMFGWQMSHLIVVTTNRRFFCITHLIYFIQKLLPKQHLKAKIKNTASTFNIYCII